MRPKPPASQALLDRVAVHKMYLVMERGFDPMHASFIQSYCPQRLNSLPRTSLIPSKQGALSAMIIAPATLEVVEMAVLSEKTHLGADVRTYACSL